MSSHDPETGCGLMIIAAIVIAALMVAMLWSILILGRAGQ